MAIGPDDDGFNPSAFTETQLPDGTWKFAPSEGGALSKVANPLNYFSDPDLIDQTTGIMNADQRKIFEQRNKQNSFDFMSTYGPYIVAAPIAGAIAAGGLAAGAGAAEAGASSLGGGLASAGAVDAAAAGGLGAGGAFSASGLGAEGGLGYGALDGASGLGGDGGGGGGADGSELVASGAFPAVTADEIAAAQLADSTAFGNGGGAFGFDSSSIPLTDGSGFDNGWGTDETAATGRDELAGISRGVDVPNPTSTIAQKLLDQLQKNPLTAAGLAANVASQIAQKNSANNTAGKLNAIAAPTAGLSSDLLAQYKSGQLNAGSEFDINKWEQQAIAKAKSYYSKAGMPDSTAALHSIQTIQAQANAMRDQSRQGLLTAGLNASQIAQGPLTAAVNAQANQDANFARSQASALNSLMLLKAMESKTPAAVT